jgi:5-epi-alpha-selinene synthase
MEQELICPFMSALNTGTQAAHEQTREWANGFGLVRNADIRRQVLTERFTWLVGGFYPWAQPRELQLISDFTSWLFWHDDVCDETALGEDPAALGLRFDQLLGVFARRAPAGRDDPFAAAFGDLGERFAAAAPTQGWLARMVASLQQYFEGCVWEAGNRRHGRVPGVAHYIDLRPFAGGMYIYRDFVELVARAELPLAVRAHSDVQRLHQITLNVACWHNDLFSLDKELARGDVHNLVLVIAREHGVSLGDARAQAVSLCNREVAAFAATAGRVPSFGVEVDAQVAGHTRALGALMRGNLDWSLGTDRYRPAREVASAPAPAAPDSGGGAPSSTI